MNKTELIKLMNEVSEFYSKEFTNKERDVWWSDLKDYSLDDCYKSFKNYTRNGNRDTKYCLDSSDIISHIKRPTKWLNDYELTQEDIKRYLC